MAINATCAGKVSPFDFGDIIRVRYKTDGRRIEGDFKAYQKKTPDQDWKLIWIEKDFYYEWYCWVETTYGGGEWKVEFIDRIAGVTEDVIFRVGVFGEDICYKRVIIHQFGYFTSLPKNGELSLSNTLEEAKNTIDYHPQLFDVQCTGPDDCTGTGKQEILETCPDGIFSKKWKTCVPLRIINKDIVEVYRRFCIYKSGGSRCIVYNNPDGSPNAACGTRLGHKYIDDKINEGCTVPEDGVWKEYSQKCSEVECYRNVIIHKSPYPPNPKWNVWTEGVGGPGSEGYDTLEQCKRYIGMTIELGFVYDQCGDVVECTEGETRNETYCPDGVTKKSWEECVSGEWKAKTQTCPVTCTEGDRRNVVLCPDGEYMRSWEECVNGEWVSKTGICGCVAGTTSCQGYDLYTCIGGEWVVKERNSEECGYTENGKIGILDPIISWIEISFDVDRKTAEMYAYLGIAGIGAVFVLGVMRK